MSTAGVHAFGKTRGDQKRRNIQVVWGEKEVSFGAVHVVCIG